MTVYSSYYSMMKHIIHAHL